MAWSWKRARAELGPVAMDVSAGGSMGGCTCECVRDAIGDAGGMTAGAVVAEPCTGALSTI